MAGLSPSPYALPISTFAAWTEMPPLLRGSSASAIPFNQSPRVRPPLLIDPLKSRLRTWPSPEISALLRLALERSFPPPWVASSQTPVHLWRLGGLWGDPQVREGGVFAALKPSRPAQCKPPPVCVNIRGRRLAAAGNRLHLSNGNAGGWGMERFLGVRRRILLEGEPKSPFGGPREVRLGLENGSD